MSRLTFAYDDGGRAAAGFRGDAGDCVVRAVAIATGQPYAAVYAALSDGCRSQRLTRRSRPKASARNGVDTRRQWFRDYMGVLGWSWVPTMHIGSGCKVHLHDDELPAGRLVVALSKHYTAVVDGVIRDTYDPRRETHELVGVPQADGSMRATPTGKVSRRCVYGYWIKGD